MDAFSVIITTLSEPAERETMIIYMFWNESLPIQNLVPLDRFGESFILDQEQTSSALVISIENNPPGVSVLLPLVELCSKQLS